MGTFTWGNSLGILLLGNCRLEHFAWNLSLRKGWPVGTSFKELPFPFAWELWLGMFRALATLPWELSLDNFRLGT